MDVLKGIKVVDVTAWAFVPSAGGVLAHWGAEVIKVEGPRAPDPMRLLHGGSLEPGNAGPHFKHYSRGKKSIGIDLATEQGRDLIYRLVADADVFLTSYLAPTRRKLGIDVEDIRKVNPRIIYARGSGHGPKGPDADRPGYDAISWWSRGSLNQSAMDLVGSDWPTTQMVGHGDGMSGLVFAGGICAALLSRERGGEPLVVDSSLLGTAAWFNGIYMMNELAHGHRPAPKRAERPPMPEGVPSNFVSALISLYQTSDNRFIYLLFLTNDDRDFLDFCQRIDRPELASDPRFLGAKERSANAADLMAILDELFRQRSFEQWKDVLAKARGAWAPVQYPEELPSDPQVVANGYVRPVDGVAGELLMPAPALQFDGEAGNPPRAPDFCEHTDELLAGLGCDAAEVARLREAGVVA
ncbi:MAG: CoA transferase [Novosphingobium sp.]|nr:CoA transferase [Novosphingobium sp.]